MSAHRPSAQPPSDHLRGDILKIAIMAVGGQGGGVLTNWIEDLARAGNFHCQATSVAGVAQRTGATIYYVEIAGPDVETPVFSLSPAPGDVDIVIAAELMEAGRAIMRGLVTPDRTTLIASSHRALAVSEKMAPGDGIANADEVWAAADVAARHLVCFDMESLAIENGSVISATLFGALAGSGALPFAKQKFVDAIQRGGKGVDASLRAFEAACDGVTQTSDPDKHAPAQPRPVHPSGPAHLVAQWAGLQQQALALPDPARDMAQAGLRKLVAFMDADYGREYLDRLAAFTALDSADKGYLMTVEAARQIANAMAYDDVIRVADLKTAAGRRTRICAEMDAAQDEIVQITEFMHPRAEEIAGLMPARMGRRIADTPRALAMIDRWFCKGRRMRTDRIVPFLMLYALGGLRRYRRRTLRHEIETAHLNHWLGLARDSAQGDYLLGVEILRCQRLIKGYSGTHSRTLSKFDKVLGALDRIAGRPDAADMLGRLRQAALEDEDGKALDDMLATLESKLANPA